MHSSRMRTARSSGRPGGVSTRHPPGAGTPRSRHPPEEAPPGAGTPLPRPGTHTPSQDQAPPPPGPGTLTPLWTDTRL